MIPNPRQRLVLGSLELVDPLGPYSVEADGYDTGSAESVNVVIRSLLQDGSLVRTERVDNRERSFIVRIEAPDGIALAEAERALALELYRPNTLTWYPPDGIGPATVWDVQTSRMDELFDDMGELLLQRRYRVVLTCLPWGRSTAEVVTAGLASGASPSSSVVNSGEVITDWQPPATVATYGGTNWIARTGGTQVSYFPEADYKHYSYANDHVYQPAAPINFSTEQYLSVDVVGYVGATAAVVIADGVAMPQLGAVAVPGTDAIRYFFLVTDASVSQLIVRVRGGIGRPASEPGVASVTTYVKNLVKTNQAPSVSTARQSLRSIAARGAVRAPATLAISSAAALGDVIVYTHPDLGDGYQPACRRYMGGATQTDDTAIVSGKYSDLGSTYADVPASTLAPGGYLVMVRVRTVSGTASGNITARAELRVGSSTHEASQAVETSTRVTDLTSAYRLVAVGGLMLPPARVPSNSSAVVRISFPSTMGARLDELWLFRMTDGGALSVLNGVGRKNVWLDAPTPAAPLPGMYVGDAADRADAVHAGAIASAWGSHQFRPPQTQVFVVTAGALNPDVSARYFPRWHSNAAE